MSDTLTFPAWCDDPEPRTVPRSECHRLTIPTLFYDDHVWRALTAGVVVKSGRYVTTVWLDSVCLEDLIGDAYYYTTHEGEDYTANRSVCDSARSTMRSLRRQVPEPVAAYEEEMRQLSIRQRKMWA